MADDTIVNSGQDTGDSEQQKKRHSPPTANRPLFTDPNYQDELDGLDEDGVRLDQQRVGEVIQFWAEGAWDAWEAVGALYEVKKYHFALFFCHLALEKQIKALVVKKTKKPPLPIHDLVDLAKRAEVKLTAQQVLEWDEINSFNLKGRYSEYKKRFYFKATKEYADKWIAKSKEILVWLKAKV